MGTASPKLGQAHSVIDVGEWCQSKGITVSQHPHFGGVDDVHTDHSLHYGGALNVAEMKRKGLPGLALDLNDNDPRDDKFSQPMSDETAALTFVYFRVLTVAEAKHWPLDEMFFFKWGFLKETGYDVNHPISGHGTHGHVGFSRATW